jgi:hypothetical protein
MSDLVSATQAASCDIGTQTSVEMRLALGRSARGPIRVVARAPKPGTIFGLNSPIEPSAVELGGNVVEARRLFAHARCRSVEFEKEERRLGQFEPRVSVAGAGLNFIHQLDARDRNAGLDRCDHGIASSLDGRKRTDAAADLFRNAAELERDLGDDGKRAL